MRILVVEDQTNIANNLRDGLQNEGFSVDIAETGEKAYDVASVEEFDAIVLDVMLPGMDGIEVCRRLRDEKILTPIIMVTAKDSTEDKVASLETGADDYVTKPFSFDELLARIRSLIRRSNSQTPVLKLSNLELNPSSHIVKRSGKEISLTAKEYVMLEYFMNNIGKVLLRDQILTHVWDSNYESINNIVDVFVKRLRDKVEKPFPKETKLLKTIRGLGYKFG